MRITARRASAREEMLAAVRAAVVGAEQVEPARPERPRSGRPATEVVALFCERAADYRAEVVTCAPEAVEAEIVRALAGDSVVVPDGFGWQVPGALRDESFDAPALDGIGAVVTAATLGVAVTGTLVLTHGAGEGRRALSLVPDKHVCVVWASDIVEDVPDAVGRLDPSGPTTWISGPSATSDIELQRVEGVHGPRTLVIIVVSGE